MPESLHRMPRARRELDVAIKVGRLLDASHRHAVHTLTRQPQRFTGYPLDRDGAARYLAQSRQLAHLRKVAQRRAFDLERPPSNHLKDARLVVPSRKEEHEIAAAPE